MKPMSHELLGDHALSVHLEFQQITLFARLVLVTGKIMLTNKHTV